MIEEKTREGLEQEEIIRKKKKKNIALYTMYRCFSWDLLFYYAIIYLFLTIEKGLSPAQYMQFDAFYVLFKCGMQIPCTMLIGKIGKRNSLVLANFVLAFHILVIIFSQSFAELLLSQVFCAFAFITKATCESDMLYDALEHNEKRGGIFSKLDGKAMSIYYYLDAISAVLSGFLFVVNAYIPMVICFIIAFISFLVSTKFEDIEVRKKVTIKEEFKGIRYAFRGIFHSKRLKSLLVFNGIFVAILRILQTLRNTILTEMGVEEQYFGVIFAALGIISGIAARNQGRIHAKFRNKTLAFLSIPTACSCLVIGLGLFLHLPIQMMYILVAIGFMIQYIAKGPYYVLIKRYFNNFTTSQKRVKIATVNNIMENAIAAILVFVASYVLEVAPIYDSVVIIGCLAVGGVVLWLDHMRDRVGLKMEEYSKRELK